MINVGNGRMFLSCEKEACKAEISVLIVKGRPAITGRGLYEAAKNAGWNHTQHLCPKHK